MGKERFLRELKKFDDNFINSDNEFLRKLIIDRTKELKKTTIKNYMIDSNEFQYYASQINYNLIKTITYQNYNEDSFNDKTPFSSFYEIEDLEYFFRALNRTNLFLIYHEKYEFDRLRTYEEKEQLKKHYKTVIEDLKIFEYDEKLIKRLEERKNNLYRTFPTQQQILEDFLMRLFIVLTKKKIMKKPTQKIANITNEIIKEYFAIEKDKKNFFSKNTDLTLFDEHHYIIGFKQTLFHKRTNGL